VVPAATGLADDGIEGDQAQQLVGQPQKALSRRACPQLLAKLGCLLLRQLGQLRLQLGADDGNIDLAIAVADAKVGLQSLRLSDIGLVDVDD